MLLALTCVGPLGGARADKALDILRKSIAADGQVAYWAEVEITVRGKSTRVFRQDVLRASGNKYRIRMTGPGEGAGPLIVSDGRVEWEYRPSEGLVHARDLAPLKDIQRAKLGALQTVQGTLHASYLGQEGVAGRTCHVIAVKPPDGRRLRKKVWVDAGKFVELKGERYDSAGRLETSSVTLQISFQVNPGPGDFEFRPPARTQVRRIGRVPRLPLQTAEKKVGFRAVIPSYLPPGFALDRTQVRVAQLGGQAALWLEFFDGVDTFSIFQCPRLRKAPPQERGATYWEAQGLSFLLIGRLSTEERSRVRHSTLDQ